jgi:hypothetical protein
MPYHGCTVEFLAKKNCSQQRLEIASVSAEFFGQRQIQRNRGHLTREKVPNFPGDKDCRLRLFDDLSKNVFAIKVT